MNNHGEETHQKTMKKEEQKRRIITRTKKTEKHGSGPMHINAPYCTKFRGPGPINTTAPNE